jgi:alpha-amylase
MPRVADGPVVSSAAAVRRVVLALLYLVLPACSGGPTQTSTSITGAPLASWTRGATCYEIFVRSFQDSNGDGIGDINGLISRLDYINDGDASTRRDLGARCLWLMPMSESPSYHGYDVADYYSIERDYGTTADFKRLVAEAHRRGIRVLIDMVLNHASSEHPYFQAALRDPSSQYRAWFRWAPTRPAELNPWGYSNWHKSPLRDEWYYGFFSDRMPDLNYRHPPVLAEAKKVARYWLEEIDVDGFRLDAIPYLVEEPGRINHSAGTHAVLREYAAYVRSVKPDAFTVGEVSDNSDAMAGYYPDQLDSHFAFEVADSLIAALRTGSAKGVLPPIVRLQRELPANRWSPFLRNHDQPRTRTELGGDRAKARLASFLMLTLPGVPFVYYGEEIGMLGAKPDERLRTPMQWTAAAGAGFTTGRPWQPLQEEAASTTVEAQETDPRSILALHRELIPLRDANPALAAGRLIPLTTNNDAVTAFVRAEGDRRVLVIANVGTTALRDVAFTSESGALPAGRWTLRDLRPGRTEGSPLVGDDDSLSVGEGGQLVRYVPAGTLQPLEGYLFELVPAR